MKLPAFFVQLRSSTPSAVRTGQRQNTVSLAALNQGCGDCMVVDRVDPELHEVCRSNGENCLVVANEGREACMSATDIRNHVVRILNAFEGNPELQQAALAQILRDYQIVNRQCVRLRDLRVRADNAMSIPILVS